MSFYKMSGGVPPKPNKSTSPSLLTNSGIDYMNLSLQGSRIAPREPGKAVAFVPEGKQKYPDQGAKTMSNKKHLDQTVFQKKERFGYGGGFKIPEEYRKNKLARKKSQQRGATDEDEQEGSKDQSVVTKDEILAHLNLGTAESSIGGKYG
jgi:hypothetical protein